MVADLVSEKSYSIGMRVKVCRGELPRAFLYNDYKTHSSLSQLYQLKEEVLAGKLAALFSSNHLMQNIAALAGLKNPETNM